AVIDKKPQAKTCDAIVGITEEGAEIMEEYKGSPALDAGLLAAAQAVEHYEISRYGTLIAWAEELGLDDAVSLLEDTLEEEKATDEALTEIAKSAINQQAEAAEEVNKPRCGGAPVANCLQPSRSAIRTGYMVALAASSVPAGTIADVAEELRGIFRW